MVAHDEPDRAGVGGQRVHGHAQVPPGRRRADVLGHHHSGDLERLTADRVFHDQRVAVELAGHRDGDERVLVRAFGQRIPVGDGLGVELRTALVTAEHGHPRRVQSERQDGVAAVDALGVADAALGAGGGRRGVGALAGAGGVGVGGLGRGEVGRDAVRGELDGLAAGLELVPRVADGLEQAGVGVGLGQDRVRDAARFAGQRVEVLQAHRVGGVLVAHRGGHGRHDHDDDEGSRQSQRRLGEVTDQAHHRPAVAVAAAAGATRSAILVAPHERLAVVEDQRGEQ